MEIVVTGRHVEVKDRFRRHLEEKLAKVEQLQPKVLRLDVVISHERNRRQSDVCDRVEVTCVGKGPVVRAEACAADHYAALDLAYTRLLERLRRQQDKRRVHRGRHTPVSVAQATAGLDPLAPAAGLPEQNGAVSSAEESHDHGGHDAAGLEGAEGSPLLIREKVHAAVPMSLDQALYEMELVGHDFYLFLDKDSHRPSVVYRRRGWSYGVIQLAEEEPAAGGDEATENAAAAAVG